jgi:2-iminobutanoate/2-iminopropanoate deaminase
MRPRRRIETDTAPPSTGFRSQAVIAGGLLFTGGQIGASYTKGQEVRELSGNLEDQVENCLVHLDSITRAAGFGNDRVIEVSAFIVEGQDHNLVRRLVEKHLRRDLPLFKDVKVRDVAIHGLLELDWIALANDDLDLHDVIELLSRFGTDEPIFVTKGFAVVNNVTAPGNGMEAQSEALFKRVSEQLSEHGSSLEDLVKLTVFIDEFDNYPEFNEVTKRLFGHFMPPTRSVVVAPEITSGSHVRVDCLALRGSGMVEH